MYEPNLAKHTAWSSGTVAENKDTEEEGNEHGVPAKLGAEPFHGGNMWIGSSVWVGPTSLRWRGSNPRTNIADWVGLVTSCIVWSISGSRSWPA